MYKHLDEVNMTYLQHFIFSLQLAVENIVNAVVLVIHAIFPCFFTTYFSEWIESCSIRLKRLKK